MFSWQLSIGLGLSLSIYGTNIIHAPYAIEYKAYGRYIRVMINYGNR